MYSASTIVAQGERIGLRPFEEVISDAEIARIYRWSGDQTVLRWSGGTPTELSFTEFREHLLRDFETKWDNRLVFLIVTNDGTLIGRIGIFAIDWTKREGELGIAIGEPAYWGQGYGRDAVVTLLRYAFETTVLDRINLYTFVDNVRAQKCFTACGFRALSMARRFSPDIGEYDGIEMEITRGDFARLQRGANGKALKQPQIPLTQDAK
jgi:RimJ/RimL family protein N-acetyltransferase